MRRHSGGFTMVELVIVLLVVAILSAIAVPAYRSQMFKGRRADAREAVTQIQQAQERWRSTNATYAATVAALGQSATSSGGNYALSVSNATASGYTVTATAQARQAGDTNCTPMTLTVAGNNTTYGPTNAYKCWGF